VEWPQYLDPRAPKAGDFREEVSGGAPAGWRPGLQDEVQDDEEPEAGRHGSWEYQEACPTVLLGENRPLPYHAVPTMGKEPAHPAVLVVPASDPDSGDSGAPHQGVSGVEGPTKDPVGGGVEGDREVEEQVEDPGPPGRWAMQPGGAGLPLCHRCWKTSAG